MESALQRLLEQKRAVAGAAIILGGRDANNHLAIHYLDEAAPQAQLRSDGQLDDVSFRASQNRGPSATRLTG